MIYANKDIYEGNWKENQKSGKGSIFFANMERYEGEF